MKERREDLQKEIIFLEEQIRLGKIQDAWYSQDYLARLRKLLENLSEQEEPIILQFPRRNL